MLKLGSLKLSEPIILAPMASVGDLPFRKICRKFGCELAFVEMLNARSVCYHSWRTKELLNTNSDDRPLGVQLLGCEEKYVEKALSIVEEHKFDVIDFNAACPKRKVVRRGEGAGLLKDPKKLKRLLKILVKNSGVPVTVKIRTGWDKLSINAKDVALLAQDAGVDSLFIHGRNRLQEYSGDVDYNTIRKVKKGLSIPVIASGNIFSAILAKKMFDETGCDGLLIARGAIGNPWIFEEIANFLKTGRTDYFRPDIKKITKTMIEHINLCTDFYGERRGVLIFRKFFAWYTNGFKKIRLLRKKVCLVKDKEELIKIIENLSF